VRERCDDGKVGIGGTDSVARQRSSKTKAKGRKGVRHGCGSAWQKNGDGSGGLGTLAAGLLGAVAIAGWVTWRQWNEGGGGWHWTTAGGIEG